ncbi:hypothetical protein ASPVEDRAFT_82357 [Aspergillus versicolor CBS 583.65]|uniref:Uncharacterized protein n=1 Tax=Aspergillus versicolor CBS 583.65 TaxID=1036611 RepID=A0A1L9PH27_ASPVE|nr:uncharacterized protein ASPVEDRAFT_82357 [Aspergillus versicolor CBS 583.65]OJJ00802.1 hypothetical protein ASPVEDRAFT_82357 [Aspergillus versicolor CBS 583.65]
MKGFFLVAATVCRLATALSPRSSPNITVDDWSSLPPSPDLKWTPCLQNYTCAKLQVPLDYGDPSRGTTGIAFLKLPAKNATNDTQSILINPGGPGGSGIETLLTDGSTLAEIVQGRHDIVGFDTRGVGQSGPVVDCWPGNPAARAQFESLYYPDSSDTSSTSIGRQYAAADIFGRACTDTVGGSNGTAAFVSTPAVARDMLSFVKAEHAGGKRDGKLWYIGVSYGTVLGATFAHLFPDHVGRMVLDGVDDAEDYYRLGWKANLYDTDKALDSFIDECFEAGPKNCSFWSNGAQNIRERLDTLLQDLHDQPIPIPTSDACPLPILATYSDLKQLILQSMYAPLQQFTTLADVLSSLEQGNTSAYAAAVTSGSISANPCNYNYTETGTEDINTLIACTDGVAGHGDQQSFQDLSQFKTYVDDLTKQSSFFGEVWPKTANAILCRSLDVSPPETGRLAESILETRHTANPILFATSEIDPVTPKRGAHKMSSVFPGSTVLTQNSTGHAAIVSATTCLVEHLQEYFQHGQLPPANTTCQPDVKPFQESP